MILNKPIIIDLFLINKFLISDLFRLICFSSRRSNVVAFFVFCQRVNYSN